MVFRAEPRTALQSGSIQHRVRTSCRPCAPVLVCQASHRKSCDRRLSSAPLGAGAAALCPGIGRASSRTSVGFLPPLYPRIDGWSIFKTEVDAANGQRIDCLGPVGFYPAGDWHSTIYAPKSIWVCFFHADSVPTHPAVRDKSGL